MRRWLVTVLLVLATFACATHTLAVDPDEILTDPSLEVRARALSKELRCMVCQNQSIDDSDAPLARDLRILVRERLKSGDSDRQVIEFLVARYGEFVLLRPRFSAHTAVLWLAPAAILLLGAIGLLLAARRYRLTSAEPAGDSAKLSPAEEARLADVLRRGDGAP
jgi:cytochrome c-type biogenesis protein CcmH